MQRGYYAIQTNTCQMLIVNLLKVGEKNSKRVRNGKRVNTNNTNNSIPHYLLNHTKSIRKLSNHFNQIIVNFIR